MKNHRKIEIVILFIICEMMIIPFFVRGAETTETVIAEKDSYVDSSSPHSNYGGKGFMRCGAWGSYNLYIYEAYISFNLDSIPEGWTRVEISLDFSLVSQTLNFDIHEVSDDWEEYEIDWANKPKKDSKLTTLRMVNSEKWTEDITSHVSGNSLSICVSSSNYEEGDYVWIASREDSSTSDRPTLEFTYETSSGSNISTIMGSIFILFLVGAFIVVGLIFIYFQDKKKKIQQASQQRIPPRPQQPSQQSSQQVTQPRVIHCTSCGAKISAVDTFCKECGAKN